MRINGKQLREAQLSADHVDLKARTATLAFSSETPVRRWYGEEILDHARDSVRLDRLRSGGPVLMGHDPKDQVGVVEFVSLGSDRRARAVIRFSRSTRGEEVLQDVADGIVTKVSVGYIVHELRLEKEEGHVSTYRVTDWEPLEISLVSIPADTTVGIGRSASITSTKGNHMSEHDNGGEPLSRRERRLAVRGEGGHSTEGAPALQALEVQRQSDLLAAARDYRDRGGFEIAEELIRGGGTMEDFKRKVLERMRTGPAMSTAEPYHSPFDSGAREVLPTPQYFRGENASQRAYRAGMWLKARYGNKEAERWCADHGVRAMSGEILSQGGALVPDELSATIIDLADTYGTFRAEGDVWPMSSDTLTVPKSTGDPTAAFVSESGAIPESAGTWGAVNLVAKKIGTTVRVPTELMEDSVISIADRVAFELHRAFVKLEDQCGFLGDGTSTYGGMTGIFVKLVDGSHDASKVAAASATNFTSITAADLAKLVALCPEYALAGAKFYCSGKAWSNTFFRLLAGLSGNAASDLAGKMPKFFGGFPVVTSPVLPADTTANYSGDVMIAFGNLRLSSKFGSRRDITVKVLTETYAAYDQVGIQGTERFHIVNHDLGTNTVEGPMVGLVGT